MKWNFYYKKCLPSFNFIIFLTFFLNNLFSVFFLFCQSSKKYNKSKIIYLFFLSGMRQLLQECYANNRSSNFAIFLTFFLVIICFLFIQDKYTKQVKNILWSLFTYLKWDFYCKKFKFAYFYISDFFLYYFLFFVFSSSSKKNIWKQFIFVFYFNTDDC